MDKHCVRVCTFHGETKFTLNGKHYGCAKCKYEYVRENRRKIKTKLIKEAGGCCQKCGYDKCNDALEFHHKDPLQKSFSIGESMICSFKRLQEEIKKCILICANCHRELHAEEKTRRTFNNPILKRSDKICSICHKQYTPKDNVQKFCSIECYGLSTRKVTRPNKQILELEIANNNFVQLGKKYGVSDNAVRKWAKKYGIPL